MDSFHGSLFTQGIFTLYFIQKLLIISLYILQEIIFVYVGTGTSAKLPEHDT